MEHIKLEQGHLEALANTLKAYGFIHAEQPLRERWIRMNQYQRKNCYERWLEFTFGKTITVYHNGRNRTFAAVKIKGVPQCSG